MEKKDGATCVRYVEGFRERFASLRGPGQSQADFAEVLGISSANVGFYENGDRMPDAKTLSIIARVCDVSVDWLLCITEHPTASLEEREICDRCGLTESSLEALESLIDFQGEEVYGMNIDYRSALNALLPTKQFILLLRYMEFAKASHEYAKREEEEKKRRGPISNDISFDTGKNPDGFETWSIDRQNAYREQEAMKALENGAIDDLRSVIQKTTDMFEPIKARNIAKKHRGVWLDADEAVDHYARQAAKWIEEAIFAYYDGKAEELNIFRMDGDPDA
ncbi:MAG: helix-turn-helix domain-containing protein [Firmicutes bacterium]|nr:helix-turn-helix domain-containing protein [Bacillota bacterium]